VPKIATQVHAESKIRFVTSAYWNIGRTDNLLRPGTDWAFCILNVLS